MTQKQRYNSRKIAMIVLLLLLFIKLEAQHTTWEYVLRTPDIDEETFTMTEGIDGSFYIGGRSLLLGQEYPYKSLVFKLNQQGTLVDSIHFTLLDKWSSLSNIFSINEDNLRLISTFRDSNSPFTNGGFLINGMNSNLELTNQNVFWADTSYLIFGAVGNIDKNGSLFVNLSVNLPVSSIYSYLVEVDSSLNINKQKFLIDYPKAYSHLKKIDDNTYWGLNLLTNKYEMFDSAFNIVGEQKVPERMTANFGVKWDSDSSFYLLGENNEHQLGFLRQPHYFDTTDYLFNSWGRADTVDFPAFTNGIDFRNKDSIFIGGTHNMPYALDPGQQPVPTWFVILQTDSLLNVRWERFYGGNANHLMTNLIATHDGGCLIAGTRYDYMNDPVPQTDIIVLKLNSEGLLVGQNELHESLLSEAIVYPNPGSTLMQVRLAVQHPKALLELFDSQGKLVLSQQLHEKESRINTAQLPPGTYIYRLSAATGLNESGKWVKR